MRDTLAGCPPWFLDAHSGVIQAACVVAALIVVIIYTMFHMDDQAGQGAASQSDASCPQRCSASRRMYQARPERAGKCILAGSTNGLSFLTLQLLFGWYTRLNSGERPR